MKKLNLTLPGASQKRTQGEIAGLKDAAAQNQPWPACLATHGPRKRKTGSLRKGARIYEGYFELKFLSWNNL